MNAHITSGIIGAACAALVTVVAPGCSKKKDAPDKGDTPATGAAANPSVGAPAASAGASLYFDGLPVSNTRAEVLALIAESSEHWDLESTTRAHDLAVQATEKQPESILAWLHRADAALSPEESAEASARAQALEKTANPVERALLEVRLGRESGDTDRALRAAKKVARLAEKSPEAHLVVSRVHTLRGEDEPARAAALAAVELDPESLSAHALLGESYTFREPRDLEKAAYHFKRTVELRPRVAATYVSLGDVYRAGLDLEAASVEYGKAMAADPKYPVGPVKRGHINSFLGNYDQARADYDAGIALGTTRFGLSLSNYRAFVSIHEGAPEAALTELEALLQKARAAELEAGERNELVLYILENRAVVASHVAGTAAAEDKQGAVATAVAAVDALVAEHARIGSEGDDASKRKHDVQRAYWQCRSKLAQGAIPEALERAEAYARLVEPDSNPRKLERYHELRGLIDLEREKYADAVEHLRKSDLQTTVFAKYQLARALTGAGETDEARKLFREVADFNFNSPEFALLRKPAQAQASDQ